MRDKEYFLGKKVKVKYKDCDDDYIYEGIISGYCTVDNELVLGFDEPQNNQSGWTNTSCCVIRYPKKMYFWAHEEDTEIEVVE